MGRTLLMSLDFLIFFLQTPSSTLMASLQLGLQHSVSTGCAPVEFTEREGERRMCRGEEGE